METKAKKPRGRQKGWKPRQNTSFVVWRILIDELIKSGHPKIELAHRLGVGASSLRLFCKGFGLNHANAAAVEQNLKPAREAWEAKLSKSLNALKND